MVKYITIDHYLWHNYHNEISRIYKKRNSIDIWITENKLSIKYYTCYRYNIYVFNV